MNVFFSIRCKKALRKINHKSLFYKQILIILFRTKLFVLEEFFDSVRILRNKQIL